MEPQTSPAGETPFDRAVRIVPFLEALKPPDRERLRPYARRRTIARGGFVWHEGDATSDFTFLIDGRVKLAKPSEMGRDVIVDLCGPGELLCSSAVCAFAQHCCTALALEGDAEVLVLPRRDVLELLERSPEASRAFIREITDRGLNLTRRIHELASGQVERRIAILLLRLAEQLGEEGRDGEWRVPISLSRQDLADLCGTTMETTIRVMTRLGREGVVQTAPPGIVITNRRRLEEIARGPRCR